MFLRCSYFLTKSEADVLINSVLIKRKACRCTDFRCKIKRYKLPAMAAVAVRKKFVSIGHFSPSCCL